jgi:hypothetical protein
VAKVRDDEGNNVLCKKLNLGEGVSSGKTESSGVVS